MKRILILATAALLLSGAARAADSPLQTSLKDSVGEHWIYDDFAKATTEAKSTGKPILALFR